MDIDLLFDNFDSLVKSSTSLSHLSEAFLALAVQGKLVPQNPNDEPASEILEKIRAKKTKLISEKKIKKEKALTPIKENEIRYELPKGWEWVRLGNIVEKIGSGSTPRGGRSVYTEDGIMFIRSQNVWNDGLRTENIACIPESINERMKNTQVLPMDLLLNITGASIGRSCIVPDDFGGGNVSQHVSIIRLIERDIRKYVHTCIISPFTQERIMDVQVGISREGLSKSRLADFPIPLPPLNEQKRIADRIESLLDKSQQIEAQLSQAEQEIVNLNESALNRLLEAGNDDELRESWQFIYDNFDLLYSHERNIAPLRQAILQLAVKGKLVPQDPNDEPASELVGKIKTEKQQLIKAKKIKKEKPLPPISEDEVPYKLPDGWEWARLGETAINIHYGFTASADSSINDVRFLRITDIQNNKVVWENVPGCEIDQKDSEKYQLNNDDILIARTGGTIGKSYLVESLQYKAIFASYLIRIIPTKCANAKYIKLFLESPLYWKQLFENSRGTGQPNVNATSLKGLRIPLPPSNEQKRIIEKVDELLSLCDELETQLAQSKEESEKLMQAVLQEAFQR